MTPLKMKYLLFFSMLLILTIGTIGNAFYRHNQYYPAIVYLSKSSASLTVAYFVASNLLWVFGYWAMMLFFGELRPSESEELWERLKYVATETLMAFAIFRDDFSPHFALLFAVLLYMKIIHWLGEERVDYLERSPVIPKLFHARILSLLILLGVLDISLVTMACKAIQITGPSPHIAFGFEYAILLPSVFCIVLKYVLHTVEIHRETPLEDKAVILLYGQIIFDFIRIVLYFSYLAVMFRLYLLPAFAFRQIFNTMRNFTSAVNDVVSFRKAVKYMNKFCPAASKEELDAADSVCIVCREDMHTGAKKLPCNHIFHGGCLRSWFQRQQTCPTCRLKILNSIQKGTIVQENNQEQRTPPSPTSQRQSGYLGQHNETTNQNSNNVPQEHNSQTPQNDLSQRQGEYQHCTSIYSTHSISYIQQQPKNGGCSFAPSSSSQLVSSQAMALHEDETLRSLSSQDLLAVERDTRVGIENRIKCLQNMSKMLDSTIVMMHQYCHATALSSSNKECNGVQEVEEYDTENDDTTGVPNTIYPTEPREID